MSNVQVSVPDLITVEPYLGPLSCEYLNCDVPASHSVTLDPWAVIGADMPHGQHRWRLCFPHLRAVERAGVKYL